MGRFTPACGVSWGRVSQTPWYNIGVDNRQRVKRSPGSGSGSATEGVAAYLSDPSFAEENAGPLIEGRWRRSQQRDPSPAQIRRRCEAIRRAYPRRPVGEAAEPWTPPEVEGPADFDIAKVA